MKFLLLIIAACSLSSMALADDTEQPTGTAALLCKMSRNALTTMETLSLDYDQKLVNGIPATYTKSMITWMVHHGSESEHHELNRLTGTYDYWTEDKTSTETVPTFVCVKAPEKF